MLQHLSIEVELVIVRPWLPKNVLLGCEEASPVFSVYRGSGTMSLGRSCAFTCVAYCMNILFQVTVPVTSHQLAYECKLETL